MDKMVLRLRGVGHHNHTTIALARETGSATAIPIDTGIEAPGITSMNPKNTMRPFVSKPRISSRKGATELKSSAAKPNISSTVR